MKIGNVFLIVALSALIVGGVLYFTVFKKSTKQMKDEIAGIMLGGGDSQESKNKFLATLDKMTEQEIKDVYAVYKIFQKSGGSKTEIKDLALRGRFEAISLKYDIFG